MLSLGLGRSFSGADRADHVSCVDSAVTRVMLVAWALTWVAWETWVEGTDISLERMTTMS